MPDWLMLLEPLLGLFGVGLGAGVNAHNNERNIQMQRETNQMNLQIAREANAAQAAEHEKAFQRSKATTQVNLMRAAGMSKAGALNALSGGGVYTPAPVNTAQMQSPSSNVDGIVNALSSLGKGFGNVAQLKQAKELAGKELQARADELEEQKKNNKIERDYKELQLYKDKYESTVLSWIAEATAALPKDNVTSGSVMNYIRDHHGKDDAFKAVKQELLNNTVNAQVSQRKTNADAGLSEFNLEHAQERYDKEIEKYADEHKLSEQQYKAMKEQYKVIVQDVKEYLSEKATTGRNNELILTTLRQKLEEYLLNAQIPDAKSKADDIVNYYSDNGPAKGEEYDRAMGRFNRWLNEFPIVRQLLDMLNGAGGALIESLLTKKPLPQKAFTINITR